MSQTVNVFVPPESPMWEYGGQDQPQPGDKGQAAKQGWSVGGGQATCKGESGCAVEMKGVQLSAITFLYQTSKSSTSVSGGIDGALQALDPSASSGSSQASAAGGSHDVRFQVDQGQAVFAGAAFQTTVSIPQVGNYTLDDAASSITYTGFSSSSSGAAPPSQAQPGDKTKGKTKSSGSFYQDTVSYTLSSPAAASVKFTGSIIYIFGPVGPSYGMFSIHLDGQECGKYSAMRDQDSGGTSTLLFVGQVQQGDHMLEVRNEVEGRVLALDYLMVVSSESPSGEWATGGGGPVAPLPPPTGSGTILPEDPHPTAVFPQEEKSDTGNSSTGAIVGGIIGALLALLLLILWWRYRRYKKGGGEGSGWAAFCGPSRKPEQVVGPEKGDFKLWPMIRSRPKYATY